jgi:CYTH domain-containing protein
MHNEIERKFLVQKLPRLRGIKVVPQERYFIQQAEEGIVEEGFKRTGNVFQHELKISVASDERTQEVIVITKEEFERFKKKGTKIIYRDSYLVSEKPRILIKKYKDDYEGLVLAEVEFNTHEEAEEFRPRTWMGAEMTDTQVGKDIHLVKLSWEEVQKVVAEAEEAFNFDDTKENFN